MSAIDELTRAGLLAASRSPGRSTAYKILRSPTTANRQASAKEAKQVRRDERCPKSGQGVSEELTPTSQKLLEVESATGPNSLLDVVQFSNSSGQTSGPKQELPSREETATIPIPGTPFRLTAEGRVLVTVDLQELLTSQGIPRNLATRLTAQKDPEAVAKVLLNALYLQSQGKLQNGPGYIRAGIEDGYDLLPQVANRLEHRRRELQAQLQKHHLRDVQSQQLQQSVAEDAAMAYVLEQLGPGQVQVLVEQALELLPEPLVRRNPTLSNPFVRSKVYELACGEPLG
jgi:hypothetical protein